MIEDKMVKMSTMNVEISLVFLDVVSCFFVFSFCVGNT